MVVGCQETLAKNGGLKEYSVVYTDRALNLMSAPFQEVMKDLSRILTSTYNAKSAIIVPGSGSFAMESVARQLATGKKAMVIRNGFFSFRWSDIFDQAQGGIVSESIVLAARTVDDSDSPQVAPVPIDEAVAAILKEKPEIFFAPHVETSTGIILPDDYIKALGEAVHSVGGIFIIDGIAAGMVWSDMKELGIDVYITAPQKGWSGPACAGIVMLGERGYDAVTETTSTSMTLNLKKWRDIMESYTNGGFGYYCTMPTDSLRIFRDVALEIEAFGFAKGKEGQIRMGSEIRAMLKNKGIKSVAADGFGAPGVIVSYSPNADKAIAGKFKAQGLQIAAGVPWKINEPEGLGSKTFRLGIFGLDKIKNIEEVKNTLEKAIDDMNVL